jgi:hypothetical protein
MSRNAGHIGPAAVQTKTEGMTMTVNVGGIDRALRIVVGLALLSLFFVLQGNARSWGLLGVVALFTGISGFCPLYKLIGVNTCTTNKGQG